MKGMYIISVMNVLLQITERNSIGRKQIYMNMNVNQPEESGKAFLRK